MGYKDLVLLLKDYANAAGLRMDRNAWLILCDIVELHKPSRIDEDMTYCEGCSNSAFFPWKSCPTIQAIEKELA